MTSRLTGSNREPKNVDRWGRPFVTKTKVRNQVNEVRKLAASVSNAIDASEGKDLSATRAEDLRYSAVSQSTVLLEAVKQLQNLVCALQDQKRGLA